MVLCLKKFRNFCVGVVVWDEHRLFIGALSSLEDMGTDAEEAEVMAVM